MGPIRVLYGQKSLYGAQVGPKWDKCPESAHMVPIYTCLLVKVYQHGTYIGLIWAKSLYGAHAGPKWDKCPDSAHMGPIYTCLLGCRSTVAKIILIGNPSWLPSCLCLLYFPAPVLFTCIKSWFFRNHLGSRHQISHWSYCWNVIESLFKWSCSIDCHVIYNILFQN